MTTHAAAWHNTRAVVAVRDYRVTPDGDWLAWVDLADGGSRVEPVEALTVQVVETRVREVAT